MLAEFDPDHPAAVAREMTKKFESWYRGSVREVIRLLEKDTIKGEFTLVIGGEEKKRKRKGSKIGLENSDNSQTLPD